MTKQKLYGKCILIKSMVSQTPRQKRIKIAVTVAFLQWHRKSSFRFPQISNSQNLQVKWSGHPMTIIWWPASWPAYIQLREIEQWSIFHIQCGKVIQLWLASSKQRKILDTMGYPWWLHPPNDWFRSEFILQSITVPQVSLKTVT